MSKTQGSSKSEKQLYRHAKNALKPGECHKYLTVEIDSGLISDPCGAQITQELSQADFKTNIIQQIVPQTITWRRDLPQSCDKTAQEFLLYIVQGQEILDSIRERKFSARIQSLKGIYPDRTPVIIIYGLKDSFRKSDKSVNRHDVEMSLVEAQILHNCCHRLVENPAELAATVAQFSKSVAEIPHKREEIEKSLGESCYFSSRENVKIQNDVGYSRLWQEHLIEFPHATLETAQAITNEYPMPQLLIQALATSSDPENLLTDIPVRRSGGPLAAHRKVGQELSRKIFKLYTTENPDEIL
ncbi:hypothetical protein DMENIID0001_058090 [Sergentomyia squamirostris]